jgi:hypothetical protein
MTEWSFLTNHARVLVCIAHDPGVRLRDIATTLDITERSAYSIVTDLTASGYVVKANDGRRNRCQIQAHLPLREAITQQRAIGEVLDVLVESKTNRRRAPTGGAAPERGALTDVWACSGCRRDRGESRRGASCAGDSVAVCRSGIVRARRVRTPGIEGRVGGVG